MATLKPKSEIGEIMTDIGNTLAVLFWKVKIVHPTLTDTGWSRGECKHMYSAYKTLARSSAGS